MDPLNLRAAPPRSPYVELGGLVMLARTIDKVRATLPGGDSGEYYIKGFSQRLLDELGVSEEALRDAVAAARNDDDVVAWVRERTDPDSYARINAALRSRSVEQQQDRPGFFERYPDAREVSGSTPMFDVLELDDARMFSGAKG